MRLEDLPPLREGLAAHGLTADKGFGQHFLLDLNITRKIARLAGSLEGKAVIEVGPGPGGLTRALLEQGARVIAVEMDRRFIPLLAELGRAAAGELAIVEGDALQVDESALLQAHAPARPALVVSNLPYNVGAPLLIKWLRRAALFEGLVLMFQKEVAQRITARPGEGAYGRLGVIVQAVCRAEIAMSLPARAFTPPPKVDSAVVRLVPRPDRPAPRVLDALERVTQAAFGQRRKMLRSSLRSLGADALCRAGGVAETLRAEEVSVEAFVKMAEALHA